MLSITVEFYAKRAEKLAKLRVLPRPSIHLYPVLFVDLREEAYSLFHLIFYRGPFEVFRDIGLGILLLLLLCFCGSCSVDRLIDSRRLLGRLVSAAVTR